MTWPGSSLGIPIRGQYDLAAWLQFGTGVQFVDAGQLGVSHPMGRDVVDNPVGYAALALLQTPTAPEIKHDDTLAASTDRQ